MSEDEEPQVLFHQKTYTTVNSALTVLHDVSGKTQSWSAHCHTVLDPIKALSPLGKLDFAQEVLDATARKKTKVSTLEYIFQLGSLAVAFGIEGHRRFDAGRLEDAWISLSNACMWLGFTMGACEAYQEQRSVDAFTAASALGRLRHAENYALTDEALKYWRENIDPNLSAAKAANELVRVVPLSHKKLAEVVSAAKKKRR